MFTHLVKLLDSKNQERHYLCFSGGGDNQEALETFLENYIQEESEGFTILSCSIEMDAAFYELKVAS